MEKIPFNRFEIQLFFIHSNLELSIYIFIAQICGVNVELQQYLQIFIAFKKSLPELVKLEHHGLPTSQNASRKKHQLTG